MRSRFRSSAASVMTRRVAAGAAVGAMCGAAVGQSSSGQQPASGLGVTSGSGYVSGPRVTPPTLPYRDPQLDPSYTTDYLEPSDIEAWQAPRENWQIGIPVWYRGAYVFVVRDAEAYVSQFSPEVRAYLVPYPASKTGFKVDLVEDTRRPVTGVRQYYRGTFSTGIRLGNYEFDPSRRWFYSPGYAGWASYGGLGPGYWYWLDQTPEEIDRQWWYRVQYRGVVDGQYVPGYRPIAATPEPVVVPTARELGVRALAGGDSGEAVEKLLEHLNSDAGEGDWAARRLLAVALLAERRASDAAAFMRLAYLGDPSLAFRPIAADLAGLPGGVWGSDLAEVEMPAGLSLRSLAGDAGRYANESDSASGWFLMAVILQGEGRAERALEMLSRAEKWRLEPEVVLEMRAALGV